MTPPITQMARELEHCVRMFDALARTEPEQPADVAEDLDVVAWDLRRLARLAERHATALREVAPASAERPLRVV